MASGLSSSTRPRVQRATRRSLASLASRPGRRGSTRASLNTRYGSAGPGSPSTAGARTATWCPRPTHASAKPCTISETPPIVGRKSLDANRIHTAASDRARPQVSIEPRELQELARIIFQRVSHPFPQLRSPHCLSHGLFQLPDKEFPHRRREDASADAGWPRALERQIGGSIDSLVRRAVLRLREVARHE